MIVLRGSGASSALSEWGTHLRSERTTRLTVIRIMVLWEMRVYVRQRRGVIEILLREIRVADLIQFGRTCGMSGAEFGHEIGVLGVAALQLLLPTPVRFVFAVVLEI